MRPPGPALSRKYVLSAYTNKSKRCSAWQHHAGWQPSRDIGTFLTPHPQVPFPSVQGQQDAASARPLRYRVFYRTAFASAQNNTTDCCCLSLCESFLGGGMVSLCRRQMTPPLAASLGRLFVRSSEDFSEGPVGDLQSVTGCWLLQWKKRKLELIFSCHYSIIVHV